MITYQVEPFMSNKTELETLIKRHWEEVALDKETVPLDPNWQSYQIMEDAGLLFFMTARDEGRLVGYHILFLVGGMHYRSISDAHTDIYYVAPEYRKGFTGIRLFQRSEQELKKLGVNRIITATKLHTSPEGRNLDMGKMFKRLGYRHIENTYSKRI